MTTAIGTLFWQTLCWLDFEFGSQIGVDLKVNIYHIVGLVNQGN